MKSLHTITILLIYFMLLLTEYKLEYLIQIWLVKPVTLATFVLATSCRYIHDNCTLTVHHQM